MRLNPKIAGIMLAATAAVTAPIIAQQMPTKAPGAKNPAAVAGGTYQVDPGHTLVTWTVDHMGFTPYTGIFGQSTGTLTLDPKNPSAAKLDVTIPVSKVVTALPALTAHLLRAGKDNGKPDFFGPTPADARFVSTKVVAKGQSATVTGDLTLNGVTKPVTLAVAFYGAGTMPQQMGGGEGLGFTATGAIKRSDFGVTMGIPLVSDEVKLNIAAGFMKK